MRLLLDEQLPATIATVLQERGHDVVAIQGSIGWERLSDRDVLSLARAQRGAIVTNNLRDFRPLHHEAVRPGGEGHFGMVFMPSAYRRGVADIGRIVAALETRLREYPGERDLADAETWL